MQQFQPHLKYVSALPRESKTSKIDTNHIAWQNSFPRAGRHYDTLYATGVLCRTMHQIF